MKAEQSHDTIPAATETPATADSIPPPAKPTPKCKPRIYVASLADYNAGELHGCWIDADQDADAIHTQIAAMLAESSEPVAEEWAIHDYMNFGCLRIHEYADIAKVAEAAHLIVEHGPVFAELLTHFGGLSGIEEATRYMEDGYRGAFDRIEDYVAEFVEDCYGDLINKLPEFLRYHIDYEGIARDLEYAGDIITFECDGQVHIFDANP